MDDQLILEREYLAMVQSVLLAVVEQSDGQVASHNETIRQMLRDAWDELRRVPTALSPQDLEQLNADMDRFSARRKFSGEMAERYRLMLLSPFFARVDFKELGEADSERVMLGMYSLLGPAGRLLVTDWRAPVCSLFYDKPPGPASYDCPAGTIEGEVTLKRQYRIADGQLNYYVDTRDALDDEMLLEMLSDTSASSMRQIVSSIQREQNAAIRHELSPALMITGGAGSGKTAVAMHRAAFLMYRHRQHMSSRFMVVISPNDAFSEYISQVLPELGEDSVPTMTLAALAAQLTTKIWLTPAMTDSAYTFSAEYASLLDDFADEFRNNGPEFTDIMAEGVTLFDRAELESLYTGDFAAMSPAGRLTRLATMVEERMEGVSTRLKSRYENTLAEKYSGSELIYASKMAAAKRLFPVTEIIESMLNPSPLSLYARAITGAPLSERRAVRDSVHTGTIPYDHLVGVLYLLTKLGFIVADRSVRHVIVDEAQDYSCVAMRFLKLRYPSASFTLLGDKNQSLIAADNLPLLDQRWLTLSGFIDAPVVKLTHCYRSTYEITDFCNALLPDDAEKPLTIGRHGDKPLVTAIGGILSETAASITSAISDWQSRGMRRIGIITRDQTRAAELARFMRLQLIDEEGSLPEQGVCALGLQLAKGLEFDAVAVVWQGPVGAPTPRAALYVACTRALSYLHVFAPLAVIAEFSLSDGLRDTQP